MNGLCAIHFVHLTYPEGGLYVLLIRIIFATLVLVLAASCGGGDDGIFRVEGSGEVTIHTPEVPSDELKPIEPRSRNVNLAEARLALRELRGASDTKRREIFNQILDMGWVAVVEVDRAMVSETDELAQLDLARLRMLLLDMEEAARNPGKTDTVSAGGAGGLDSAVNTGHDSSGDSTDTGIRPNLPSDYGLGDLPMGDENFDPVEVDKFVYSRLRLAIRLKQGGENQRCREICEALLMLVPATRWRREVQQVLRDAQTGEQSVRHLAGSLKFATAASTFSQAGDGTLEVPLEISIFLKNVSTHPVRIGLGDGSGAGQESALVLDLEVTSRDAAGQEITTRGQITLRVTGGTQVLAPDEAITIRDRIVSLAGLTSSAGRSGVLSTVRASAELRPASLEVRLGEDGRGEKSFRPVSLVEDSAHVLPGGFAIADAQSRPMSFLTKALANRSYDDVFLAAPLIGEEHRQACLDILLAANLLEAGAGEQQARTRAAKVLTGEDHGASASRWVEYWTKNRHRFAFRARQ
jgi:hypothetical protein